MWVRMVLYQYKDELEILTFICQIWKDFNHRKCLHQLYSHLSFEMVLV